MSELKLLPCPFCGGEAELHDGVVIIPVIDENGAYIDADVEDTPAWVECAACGAATDGVDSADEAIERWNRRAQPENEPTTNADRIRSMSDEELQKFLRKFESGDIDYAKTFCDLCCKDAALERRSVDCDGCLLWWLKNDAKQPQGFDCWTKQPAETEGTE